MNKLFEMLNIIKFKKINIIFFNKNNKIILDKNNNFHNIKIKFHKNSIKVENTKDINTMASTIKNFLIVMNNECKNFNFDLLLENFKKTDFYIRNDKDISTIKGNVKSTDSGFLFSMDGFSTSYHELFHLSTMHESKGIGFHTVMPSLEELGESLNEGYTQLLAERYFNENEGLTYFLQVIFVRILEKIVEKDNMEKYYFTVSLQSLINNLNKYETNENIIKFIRNLDVLLEQDITKMLNPTKEQIDYFQTIITQLCEFLMSCLKNKIDIILSDNNILDKKNNINSILEDGFVTGIKIGFDKGEINECYLKMFDEDKYNNLIEYASNKINSNTSRTIHF